MNLLFIFQVIAHLLSFVDSKAVETDLMVDEEEGFMEIAEAKKKAEQTKAISKYPTHTFSGAGLLLNCIQSTPTLTGDYTIFSMPMRNLHAIRKEEKFAPVFFLSSLTFLNLRYSFIVVK